MKLKIATSDFDCDFSGYAYGPDHNKTLDEYIKIYKENDKLRYFQIESGYNDLTIHQIAYIQKALRGFEMFTKVEFGDDGNPKKAKYLLCFVKPDKEREG